MQNSCRCSGLKSHGGVTSAAGPGDVLSDVCEEGYDPDDEESWVNAPKPQELMAVATERERAGESLGRPTYRVCFRKRE